MTHVTWRGDGQLFAISTIDKSTSKIKVSVLIITDICPLFFFFFLVLSKSVDLIIFIVFIRNVYRTQSNIYEGVFSGKQSRLSTFAK